MWTSRTLPRGSIWKSADMSGTDAPPAFVEGASMAQPTSCADTSFIGFGSGRESRAQAAAAMRAAKASRRMEVLVPWKAAAAKETAARPHRPRTGSLLFVRGSRDRSAARLAPGREAGLPGAQQVRPLRRGLVRPQDPDRAIQHLGRLLAVTLPGGRCRERLQRVDVPRRDPQRIPSLPGGLARVAGIDRIPGPRHERGRLLGPGAERSPRGFVPLGPRRLGKRVEQGDPGTRVVRVQL